MQIIYGILWPSFLVAAAAEGIFFTVINPQELYLFGEAVHYSPLATYSIGFFCFWLLGAASSVTTWLLLRSAAEVNKGVGAVSNPTAEVQR
jgi:hypothetical protein